MTPPRFWSQEAPMQVLLWCWIFMELLRSVSLADKHCALSCQPWAAHCTRDVASNNHRRSHKSTLWPVQKRSHSSHLWMDCFLLARRLGDPNILWWSLADAKVDIILTYATDSMADSPTQLLRAIRLARLTRMFRAFWRKTGSAHLPNSLRRSWLSCMMLHVQIQICWQLAR